MDRDLQTLLLRDNPWLVEKSRLDAWLHARIPSTFIARSAAQAASERWCRADRAHLLIGPRQAGKSTMIWAHLADTKSPSLFIDCEQPLVRRWCSAAPLFLADLEQVVPYPVPLFFEEAQHLDDAGLFFKGLIDRMIEVPILVTGSSSFHLGARTRESLAGRATRTRLLPFSLEEVCNDLAGKSKMVREQLVDERLARHLIFGGYPEVWLSEEPQTLLSELVEAIILRDATDLFSIARPDAFRRLLRLAAGQVGNLVNLSEWASILGIGRDTVASYLEILESSHVVVPLPPFAGGRRAELTSRPKIFLVDNGIRNQLVHDFRPLADRLDAGPLFENWIFTELWKALPPGATLHHWRSTSQAEVDFVVVRGDLIVGVEVKAGRLRRPTLPRASRSFIEAYEPAKFFVVNNGLSHQESLGQTEVCWITGPELADCIRREFS